MYSFSLSVCLSLSLFVMFLFLRVAISVVCDAFVTNKRTDLNTRSTRRPQASAKAIDPAKILQFPCPAR